MAVRTVLQLGDPGLREVAKRVDEPAAPKIRVLVEDLDGNRFYFHCDWRTRASEEASEKQPHPLRGAKAQRVGHPRGVSGSRAAHPPKRSQRIEGRHPPVKEQSPRSRGIAQFTVEDTGIKVCHPQPRSLLYFLQMKKLEQWEKVAEEPLGSGGQSTVWLVRRPERTAARKKSFETLKELAGQTLYEHSGTALRFAQASFDIARKEESSELGALKLFRPRAAGPQAEEQALARIHNEIAVLGKKRPGLLKLLAFDEAEHWIVTEYCSQGTLESRLEKYKGNVTLAFRDFVPLVRTVGQLHAEGIVHRDIKPQNIFVGDRHELLLGDFGIVFLPHLQDRVSLTGESVGPRDFMPPWVLLDDLPNIRPSFDVYMLGKVLWCMITGRLKLHREDFLDPRLNVTAMFPHDPNMYMINTILEKCVVAREQDCLGSAQDLWLVAGKFLEILEQGGQLLQPEVPRPCLVCGNGFYSLQKEGSLQLWTRSNESGPVPVRLFSCNSCGHIQVFGSRQ